MPMRSSAAERVRPTVWDALVVLAVLAAAGVILFLFRPGEANLLTARVVLNNVLVEEIDLTSLTGPVTLDVPGTRYPITVEADAGRVRVAHSGCPSQDCVHTGWVSRPGGQIVCLPNRLVVSVAGTGGSDVDAVAG